MVKVLRWACTKKKYETWTTSQLQGFWTLVNPKNSLLEQKYEIPADMEHATSVMDVVTEGNG